ncbi:MAG: oxidoreductase [bacterium]|nr:MAG: oxidoreductase [bacterium]
MRITAKPVYHAALIGCGRIGSLLEKDPLREKPCTHAGAYYQHPRTSLVAGCDIDPERRSLFKDDWNISKVYDDPLKLLSNENIDILSIATEITHHDELVLMAANHHVPVILCEKPIGLSLKKASHMIKECEKNHSFLVINHERRFASDYRFVKGLIESGGIGDLVSIRGNILTGPPKAGSHYEREGGGPLVHDGTHLIDIIRFLSGSEADWVTAELQTNDSIHVEETIWATIHLKNGVHCFIEAGGRRDYFTFDLDLQGTKGKVLIGNGFLKWYQAEASRYYTGFNDLVEKPVPSFPYQPQFINEIEAVVQYLDDGTIPESTGEDGYKALEVIFALYQSAVTKERVSLPLSGIDETPLEAYF